MISLYTIITFLLWHWIFDFHLQTDEMSRNKSKCNLALLNHVLIYSLGLCLMAWMNIKYLDNLIYVFIPLNALAHFLTDWVTSRATSALYKEERYHDFFVVIGFDQLLHYVTLFGTFVWLTNL